MTVLVRRTLRLTALLVTVGLIAAGCSSTSTTGERDLHAFAEMFTGYSVDYEPAESPADLASRSDLVVRGSVTTVTGGRIWGTSADDAGSNKSVILNVRVSDTLAGELPTGADGIVYVELPSPGNVPASAYADHLPEATEGVFYLVAASMSSTDIVDPEEGRPEGQPLFEAVTPQGIVLANQVTTLQLVENESFEGSDLSEFLPDSARFPTGPKTTDEPDVPGN